MSIGKDQVCILIPTLNEAPTIGGLITDFISLGFRNILVIDGHSSDGTRKIASQAGARVIEQEGRGKGTAIIEAFRLVEEPYILMIDGDRTYSPLDAERMLAPLASGSAHVIGDRLIEENRRAFSWFNYTGNQILNRLFKLAHGRFLNDILSGYRAFTRESVRLMQLKEKGFGIETEISAEAVRGNLEIAIVPITYHRRSGTPTKLNPFHDGLKITVTIYRLAKLSNPLFYFGLIGMIVMFSGLISGAYIFSEWLKNIEHIPLTILTVLLIVVGFQIFMFGIISDMLLAFHREIVREIQDIRNSSRK
ncbi:MAG TPA: S-layer glycoprotein N-glycosyltransferase AglJ [Methanoregulaceae archaeon]|nr:MAG: S-layer glycoprotein N-glycosyltransferase AglJ [Methanolinea sp.]HON82301.1 S-layer glycoprotein N-glycosyltransferase AglJ [Methanoregulaceae archaeon]HPD11049.1 S-layer glycoprotein N-glycosyltransferase AglJ [Methanoregulaceae archaeon]HRT16134.1 S-layer glycoprotein N-glycosyltransferase AglJ [Methanoregulaceae archaeon]HRU31659.1 S-layer glycoprotein N-glycosyltransferase AglJ [Methanoregulaceae archaeon]